MNATPKTISISFGVCLYFWAVLTASRNAARFFSGELSVISPFRHMGLVFLTVILASILYFALRYFLTEPSRKSDDSYWTPPRPALPARPSTPAIAASLASPSEIRDTPPLLPLRALPAKLQAGMAPHRGFVFPDRGGAPATPDEQRLYDTLFTEAVKLLPRGAWVDLGPWSKGATLNHYETLLNWYRSCAASVLPPSDPVPPDPPPPRPRRHLRLVDLEDP